MANIDLRDASQFLNSDQIPNLMPCEVMRKSIENKNLLSAKGDLYVGTGESEDITIDEDIYTVAKTGKISAPALGTGEEAILMYDQTNGLQYKAGAQSGFLAYNVTQTIDSSSKDTLIDNMFGGLTDKQKSDIRTAINAGAAQGIEGVIAGNGISVSTSVQRPIVSVNLDTAASGALTFSADNLSGLVVGENGLRIGANVDVSTGARTISSDDTSTYDVTSRNFPVQIANNKSTAPGKMFVYVPTQSYNNQRIYVTNTYDFGSNADVQLIAGSNITLAKGTNSITINASSGVAYTITVNGSPATGTINLIT